MKNQNRSVKVIRRSDLAGLTGCNIETIRYYENIGVMPQPPRTAKLYRTYHESQVGRLRFIMRAREPGFALEEVRDLLALVDGGAQTCGEVQVVANTHLASVRAKIADLRCIEHVLSSTVAQCTGDNAPECPVIDALTEVA